MQPNPAENAYWNNYDRKGHNWKNRGRNNYDQNDGKPGVVYILANDAFPHLLKIGQSTRSAAARAQELNDSCGTESPGRFSVLHEVRTTDCGRAEKRAHKQLRKHRFRKEYFKIDVATALEVVKEACAFFNDQQEEQEKARDAKRAADEVKRAAEREVAAAAQAEQQAQAEREKLTQEEEAAIHARLIESARRFKAEPRKETSPRAKPAPPRNAPEEKPRDNPANAATYSAQQPPTYMIVGCPKCAQQLCAPTRTNLILTCPKCRYSFERTAAGQLLEHTSHANKAQEQAPSNTATPWGAYSIEHTSHANKAQEQAPSNTATPWGAYSIAVFAVVIGFWVMSEQGRSNDVSTPMPLPAVSQEERSLINDLQLYADSYRVPLPDPRGETELRAVQRVAKSIQFKYVTTARGERALSKDMDQQHIKDSMQKLACAKPDLRALIQRKALVQYQLHRKGRDTLTVTIVCR